MTSRSETTKKNSRESHISFALQNSRPARSVPLLDKSAVFVTELAGVLRSLDLGPPSQHRWSGAEFWEASSTAKKITGKKGSSEGCGSRKSSPAAAYKLEAGSVSSIGEIVPCH